VVVVVVVVAVVEHNEDIFPDPCNKVGMRINEF
jgi:hypothetical protein